MSNWDSWDEDGPLEVVVGSASIGPTTVEEKIQVEIYSHLQLQPKYFQ